MVRKSLLKRNLGPHPLVAFDRLPAEVDPRDGEVLLHQDHLNRLRLGRLSLALETSVIVK
jgi:hypothetical protein